MLVRILVALDSPSQKRRVTRLLSEVPDVVVDAAPVRRPSWERLLARRADVFVVSRSLIPDPVDVSLATVAALPDPPRVVAITASEDPRDSARLLARGAYAALYAGLADELLRETLDSLISRCREEATASLSPPQEIDTPRLGDFVSDSPSMKAFLDVVQRVVASDTTLLVQGETGVGKERLAQAIHAESPRSTGPFIAVNCGAIPEALLESELFGHVEGSFTSAIRDRRGWFELSHRGTLFLDEIAEIPLSLQVKLLRVLQTREVCPVGGERSFKVDVRVMAATNVDLEDAVRAGRFRPDLFYRLSVVNLTIPSLRDRREDIAPLARRYLEYFQSRMPTTVHSIGDDAIQALRAYSWPGNVRELINVIERAALLCHGSRITLMDLPESARGGADGDLESPLVDARGAWGEGVASEWIQRPLRDVRRQVVEEVERLYLEALLRDTGGRIAETAQRAGMNPRNLFERMRRYGLRKEDFRAPDRGPAG